MKIPVLFTGLLAAFLLSACDLDWDYEPENYDSFDINLRGTWISNDQSVYSGTVTIILDRITITGYDESQTPLFGDDDKRPFKNFTKGVALPGYTEEGCIHIKDVGTWQTPLAYEYYETIDYPQRRFLRIAFNGRIEILEKE